VAIVVGAVFVLGAGSCVVLGGLVWLGAQAEAEPATTERSPSQPPTTRGTPTATTAPSSPSGADDEPSGEAPSDGERPAGEPATDQAGADGKRPAGERSTGKAGAAPTATATSTATSSGKWLCNATGWVRVCGFANVCSNQMVSGIGTGTDRMLASMMAKNACEGMAGAKGGSTVCVVACSHH
jgi:hypothetical protein